MDWIKVCDSFPNEDQKVIMAYNNQVLFGWFEHESFYYMNEEGYIQDLDGIIHWMPFPILPIDICENVSDDSNAKDGE